MYGANPSCRESSHFIGCRLGAEVGSRPLFTRILVCSSYTIRDTRCQCSSRRGLTERFAASRRLNPGERQPTKLQSAIDVAWIVLHNAVFRRPLVPGTCYSALTSFNMGHTSSCHARDVGLNPEGKRPPNARPDDRYLTFAGPARLQQAPGTTRDDPAIGS